MAIDGNFYTPEWWLDKTDPDRKGLIRHMYLVNGDDATQGVDLQFTKPPTGNIWAWRTTFAAELRPAWYPLNANAVQDTTSTGNNNTRLYFNVTDVGPGTLEWTLPAGTPAMDYVRVHFVGVNVAGGTCKVQIDTGGGYADLPGGGVVDTETPATEPEGLIVHPLGESITATHKIRVLNTGTETCRIKGFVLFGSTGTAGVGDEVAVVSTSDYAGASLPLTEIHHTQSSAEFAVAVAPVGDTPIFIGGWQHQGGANATQVSPSETVNVDGAGAAAWALGYYRGTSVVWDRTSTSDFDGGANADIGTITESFTCDGEFLTYAHNYEPTVINNRGTTYVAMLPAMVTANIAIPEIGPVAVGVGDPGTIAMHPDNPKIGIWDNSTNIRTITELLSSSEAISSMFWEATSGRRKAYWRVPNNATVAIGADWFGSWKYTVALGVDIDTTRPTARREV